MSKIMTVLIAILVLIGSFLVIRNVKDSYKVLPIDEKNPLKSISNFQNWKQVDQTDRTFDALFPAHPQHVIDKIPDPITKEPRKYDMYAAADEHGTGFIISTITFPEKVDDKDIDAMLKRAVNDVLERNKENKLKMTKAGKFQNSDSLDFVLENKEVRVAGKVILHNNILYVLSMADKTDDFSSDELDFFVNSFHILNETPEFLKLQKPPMMKPNKVDNTPDSHKE